MSPEQARGKVVDRRTDVWAFGCVLYEMLTGRRLFEGDNITDVLGAIGHRDPDWTALPATRLKPSARCSSGACGRTPTGASNRSATRASRSRSTWTTRRSRRSRGVALHPAPSKRGMQLIPWALAVVATVAAVVLAMQARRSSRSTTGRSFQREIGDSRCTQSMSAIDVTRDGGRVALVQRRFRGTPVDRTRRWSSSRDQCLETGNPYNPFFSPDGQWIGVVTPAGAPENPEQRRHSPHARADLQKPRGHVDD
jgi:serine/threonine protein kinase